MLKQKRIVLWQNISAANPKLGERMCMEECRQGRVPDSAAQAKQISLSCGEPQSGKVR